MAYRATIVSPFRSSTFDRMPGVSATSNARLGYQSYTFDVPKTYSNKYERRNLGSSTTSYGSSRPLPSGIGPLDTSGRKLTNYSASDFKNRNSSSYVRNGPLKPSQTDFPGTPLRKTSYSSSVSVGRSYGSLHGRRSASISNLSEISTRRLTERETTPSSTYQHPHVSDNVSKSTLSRNLHSDKDVTYSRTPSRSSRASSYSTEKRDRFDVDRNEADLSRRISGIRMGREHGTGSPSSYESLSLPRRNSEDRTCVSDSQTKSVSRQSSNSSVSAGLSGTKYANSGKVGLRNLGNTCFMNSILQCLSHTRPLLEYCLKEDYLRDKITSNCMKGSLITAYANLMCSMWKDGNDTYISPNAFKTQIQRFAPRFMGYLQQDAQEFLRYLLEGLHEDVNKITHKPKAVTVDDEQFQSDVEQSREYWRNYLKFDNSRIVELFVGQLKSVLKFRDCGHRSVTFDPFWDLSLPIQKGRSEVDLIDCFEHFMKEESLDDRPTCTKCKERKSCTKGFSIQKFPKILVLHLKRFSQERYSRKISANVDFPVTHLDLSKFAAEDVSQRAIYNLYAVSNHSGSTYSGHYTAYCKHPFLNEWNLFNDTRVSTVSSNQVTSSEGYVLFYELAAEPSHL